MPKFIGYRMKGAAGQAGALVVREETESESRMVAAQFAPSGTVHSVMGNDGTFDAPTLEDAWRHARAELRTTTDN